MKLIEYIKSPNFNERKGVHKITYLILHYTAMTTHREAIEYMCEKKNKVSAHFLVSKKGEIYHLVDLNKRAWHAGSSYWKGLTDLNSNSIGIEIDNSGHFKNNENYCYKQIKSLCDLIIKLKKDYNIKPFNVLGHSDIAPFRKIDPGEKFPWNDLNLKKISYAPQITNNSQNNENESILLSKNKKKEKVLFMLKTIGYDTRNLYLKENKYTQLIKAYQMHYRQSNISGVLDNETVKLIEQHYKELLTL